MQGFKKFVEEDGDDYWAKRLAQFQSAASGVKGAISDDRGVPSANNRTSASIQASLSPQEKQSLQDGLKLGSVVPPSLIQKLQLMGAKRSLVGDVSTMNDKVAISQVRAAYPFLSYGRTIRFSVGYPYDRLMRELS